MADKNEERGNAKDEAFHYFRSLFSYPATFTEMAVPQGGSKPSLRKEIPTV
jgi:hypothetical protein